jgi:PPOX class probable F420-dependent enzyme
MAMHLATPQLVFLESERRAVLATLGPHYPRIVPVCYALLPFARGAPTRIYSAIDEKPKQSQDPTSLGRVRDIGRSPEASLLVDRWSEDWTRLAWLRIDAAAHLVAPDADPLGEHRQAIRALRARYPQYAGHDLEDRPLIRLTVEHVVSWGL